MFRKILLPLDGSSLSEAVIPFVTALAAATGAEVLLLQVATPQPVAAGHRAAPPRSYLAERGDALTQAGVQRVEGVTAVGEPHEVIVRFSEEEGCDLIAMSTHGRSGLGRWAFGSTADKVLHSSALPLLLLRPSERLHGTLERPISSLVVPLDGSPLAEKVLGPAEALSLALKAPITLLRAVPIIGNISAGPEPYAYDPRVDQETEEAARAYLREKQQDLSAKGLSVNTHLKRGYAPNQIVDFAETMPGSMIVMSTHGRSGVARWVLGSVADRVLRASVAPVLLLRSKPEAV